MPVIPNKTAMYFLKMGMSFFITWVICRILVFIAVPLIIILAIKYSAYLPDNPKYNRGHDDIKVEMRNPFTEAPSTYRSGDVNK